MNHDQAPTASEPVSGVLAPQGLRFPILDDPDVIEALQTLARATLQEIADAYRPILERARALPAEAECIEVTSAEACEFLQTWLATEVQKTEDEAKRILDPFAGFSHRLHRAFTTLRGLATNETDKTRAIAKPKIIAWGRHVDQLQRDAEDRARREREALELRAVIERMPYLGHVGLAQFAEISEAERKKVVAVEAAHAAGDHETAVAMGEQIGKIETPTVQPELAPLPDVAPPAASLAPAAPKGIAKNWKARLLEPDGLIRLIKFVAAHPEHAGLLALEQSAADKLAKVYETRLGDVIDGLEGYDDPTLRTRRPGRR